MTVPGSGPMAGSGLTRGSFGMLSDSSARIGSVAVRLRGSLEVSLGRSVVVPWSARIVHPAFSSVRGCGLRVAQQAVNLAAAHRERDGERSAAVLSCADRTRLGTRDRPSPVAHAAAAIYTSAPWRTSPRPPPARGRRAERVARQGRGRDVVLPVKGEHDKAARMRSIGPAELVVVEPAARRGGRPPSPPTARRTGGRQWHR